MNSGSTSLEVGLLSVVCFGPHERGSSRATVLVLKSTFRGSQVAFLTEPRGRSRRMGVSDPTSEEDREQRFFLIERDRQYFEFRTPRAGKTESNILDMPIIAVVQQKFRTPRVGKPESNPLDTLHQHTNA